LLVRSPLACNFPHGKLRTSHKREASTRNAVPKNGIKKQGQRGLAFSQRHACRNA